MNNLGFSKEKNMSFFDTITKVKDVLQKEGFGIITEIDFKKSLKEKIDKDIDDYVILGACSPNIAYEVLNLEYEIGLFLPCNLIVYGKEGKTCVSILKPSSFMNLIYDENIKNIAGKLEKKFEEIIKKI